MNPIKKLNFQQAKIFEPFESTGDTIFTKDQGVIAQSSPYVYKFDADINLLWSFNTKNQQDLLNIGGPYQTTNGWIFESYNNEKSFLYKMNNEGNLVWKTDEFEKTTIAGVLNHMNNGNMLFSYNRKIDAGTQLSFLIINESGNTVMEKELQQSSSINTGVIRQLIQNNDITVIGSKNLFSAVNAEIEHFRLKFNIDVSNNSCYEIADANHSRQNSASINFEELEFTTQEFDLVMVNRINLTSSPSLDVSNNLCNEEIISQPIIESNRIPCGDVWDVTLANSETRWDDGFTDTNRRLSDAGRYTARSIDCQQQEIYEYILEIEDCGCQIYIPNIFSPNGDETNDKLELGIFCSVESLDLSIFNQWGELVFVSKSLDNMWSGKINEKDAPVGTYAVLLNYKWIDATGKIEAEKIIQTVSLLR